MWTSNRGHIFRVVQSASNVIILACFRMGGCKRREMLVEKPLISYWERLHLSTRFEPDSVRKTEVTADSTI